MFCLLIFSIAIILIDLVVFINSVNYLRTRVHQLSKIYTPLTHTNSCFLQYLCLVLLHIYIYILSTFPRFGLAANKSETA